MKTTLSNLLHSTCRDSLKFDRKIRSWSTVGTAKLVYLPASCATMPFGIILQDYCVIMDRVRMSSAASTY